MPPEPSQRLSPFHQARNVAARKQLLREFGALTADELGSRGLSDRGLLSVFDPERGRVYPAFQLASDGSVRPVIEQVRNALSPLESTPWQTALWFTTASGWLADRRPVDLLDDDPDAVLQAARNCAADPAY